jgi:hypothetical protein
MTLSWDSGGAASAGGPARLPSATSFPAALTWILLVSLKPWNKASMSHRHTKRDKNCHCAELSLRAEELLPSGVLVEGEELGQARREASMTVGFLEPAHAFVTGDPLGDARHANG